VKIKQDEINSNAREFFSEWKKELEQEEKKKEGRTIRLGMIG
jgi:hypothetical protein